MFVVEKDSKPGMPLPDGLPQIFAATSRLLDVT
jgi:hypothetical protein